MAFSPRRLAAVDLQGLGTGRRRRRLVLVEFVAGVILSAVLGGYLVGRGPGLGLVVGVWLLFIGLNYLPLALYAIRFSRPGALEAELVGTDVRTELLRYTGRQFWILVPGAVVVAAVVEVARSRRPTEPMGT